jgi:hypothetical protein
MLLILLSHTGIFRAFLNNAKATILALTNLNEKIELGNYQSIHRQNLYNKIMRKYKNAKLFN